MKIKLKSYMSKKLCQVAVKQNKQAKKIYMFQSNRWGLCYECIHKKSK